MDAEAKAKLTDEEMFAQMWWVWVDQIFCDSAT